MMAVTRRASGAAQTIGRGLVNYKLALTDSTSLQETFLAEVEALRAALASSAAVHPGHAVAAAHAAIRAKIPFLDRDRALDGEVATAVRLVESGEILAAVRNR